jgi:response regulator RpfG family c-di-GMP phosphodiesterase
MTIATQYAARPGALTTLTGGGPPGRALLERLLASSIVLSEDCEALPPAALEGLHNAPSPKAVLDLLVGHSLLTQYQADRVEAGTSFGLVLGNYRILGRIGAGGMGVVYRGEHVGMRKVVAVKVLPLGHGEDVAAQRRFLAEVRAVARLQHPNIVSALDYGEAVGQGGVALHYFVMEYVPGHDLEEIVCEKGPMTPAVACGLVYQVASALVEASKAGLVHRDIKPSNVRVTPDGQAKLLDFGLVRQQWSRMTEVGTPLGTLDYLPPEQARDASTVDVRSDIYSLGGTLYWCLTGQIPFPTHKSPIEALVRRSTQPPPSARAVRPEVPAELDAVLARMMAPTPDGRYPTPQAVMNALLRFLKTEQHEPFNTAGAGTVPAQQAPTQRCDGQRRVLLVDDSPTARKYCSMTLAAAGIPCDGVPDGERALEAVASRPYDLVLADWIMPGMSGLDLCRKLRESPPCANLKIILFSSTVTDDKVSEALAAGADDYLTKQFSPVQLAARVKAALRLKESQDRADLLNRHLLACNDELEKHLSARDSDLVHVRNALVLGLADLVSQRDVETAAHSMRLQRYCQALAQEASECPKFKGQIDDNFIAMLECCAPLHDIGKAGLPDHILGKAGPLDGEERLLMQSHTTIGAETLQKVASRHGEAVAFLQMAIDIARHHHERWDGKGFPDRLAGHDIPLAARILTICDVYDGLRCRRPYKPALGHAAAVQVLEDGWQGQFDPALLGAFRRVAEQFERVFQDMPD